MENPIKIRAQPKTACPLCGTAGRGLYEHLPDCLFGTAGEWGFSQCPRSDCGLVWLNPVPLAEDLHLAYQILFYSRGRPGVPDGSEPDEQAALRGLQRCGQSAASTS